MLGFVGPWAAALAPVAPVSAQTLNLRPIESSLARLGDMQAHAEGVWLLPSRFDAHASLRPLRRGAAL